MKKTRLFSAIVVLLTCPLGAQTSAAAPVPSQLTTAKTAFLSNAGAQINASGLLSYNAFYLSLKSWNHFILMDAPANAELNFELSIEGYLSDGSNAGLGNTSFLHLIVRDVKTQTVLWALSESVRPAERRNSIDKNFSDAIQRLTDDLKQLVTPTASLPPQSPAQQKIRFQQEK